MFSKDHHVGARFVIIAPDAVMAYAYAVIAGEEGLYIFQQALPLPPAQYAAHIGVRPLEKETCEKR